MCTIAFSTITVQTVSSHVSSTEEIKENVTLCGSAIDVIKGSTVYSYNLIPEPTMTVPDDSTGENVSSEVIVIPDNGSPETTPKESIGFIINEDTPEILLSEDKEHIDLYTVVSLNWKATQEILHRLEALESEE